MGMQMHFTNPEIQAKLEQWATQTGRPAQELVEDVKRQGQAHSRRRGYRPVA